MMGSDAVMEKVKSLNEKLRPYNAKIRVGFIDYEKIVSMSLAKNNGTEKIKSLDFNDLDSIELEVDKFINENR